MQVKSSANRQFLLMQSKTGASLPTKKNPFNAARKSKKLRRPKRSSETNTAGKSPNGGGGRSKAQGGKKGIIMEMEEEYSISGGSDGASTRYEIGGLNKKEAHDDEGLPNYRVTVDEM